uniref:Uncharacterized protein n=1 Tax=Utricularia reniformis TaxID=192314 RepID=A0A1Y0AZH9_9LAMI|nr:hypothetical protein AEK19_MT0262 [Utricularia reniformis]ART30539.1 hypothetical protein AEK19_MT0262 [Utricularia reniformis]
MRPLEPIIIPIIGHVVRRAPQLLKKKIGVLRAGLIFSLGFHSRVFPGLHCLLAPFDRSRIKEGVYPIWSLGPGL